VLYLKVEEYAKRTSISHQAVYKKIKSGELKTTKKSVNGRLVTFIEIEEVEKIFNHVAQPEEQNTLLHAEIVESDSKPVNEELIRLLTNSHDYTTQLVEKIEKYAEIAGQAKLLMDSEHQTKQEYFKVVQENKQLLQEKTIVETENRLINKQLEELKQKLDTVEKKEKINMQINKEPALIEFLRKL